MRIDDLSTLKFAFCGNRFGVLDEMLQAKLKVTDIAAVEGSPLEKEVVGLRRLYTPLAKKADFLSWLKTAEFDVFVTNGCPYVVPGKFLGGDRLFVNVHPSHLPELRGAHPVTGALLTGLDSGATCHVMDAGVCTGDIISQVKIPYTDDLDAPLLQQLSLMAERQAFQAALKRKFKRVGPQPKEQDLAHYTRSPRDVYIDWSKSPIGIVRRVRAFCNQSQGARFKFEGAEFRCYDAEVVNNPFLIDRKGDYKDGEIVLRYEDVAVLRKSERFVKLKRIEGDLARLRVGGVLK